MKPLTLLVYILLFSMLAVYDLGDRVYRVDREDRVDRVDRVDRLDREDREELEELEREIFSVNYKSIMLLYI